MTPPSHQSSSLDLSHKWYAIVLSSLSDFRSTKEKIQESVLIKEHCLKAIELHGKGAHSSLKTTHHRPRRREQCPDSLPRLWCAGGDQTLNHLLGRWCFAVASISWMERKLASAIFASPPESSYDEALRVP